MKKLAKTFLLSTTSFLLVTFFFPGLEYKTIEILILAALFFGLLSLLLKPILKFFSLPLNLLTFGLFSFFIGAILLYLVSFFVAGFSILGFDFPGLEISGLSVPAVHLIPIFSAVIASLLIGWLSTLLRWLFH